METDPRPGLQALTGALGVMTAVGILIFGLFPLALPILVLTGLLLVPLLPFAILGGALVGLALAMRAAVRRLPRPRVGDRHRRQRRGDLRGEVRAHARRPGSVTQ